MTTGAERASFLSAPASFDCAAYGFGVEASGLGVPALTGFPSTPRTCSVMSGVALIFCRYALPMVPLAARVAAAFTVAMAFVSGLASFRALERSTPKPWSCP